MMKLILVAFLISAKSLLPQEPDTMYLRVNFSEPMDTSTVMDIDNYSISSIDGGEHIVLYKIGSITEYDMVLADTSWIFNNPATGLDTILTTKIYKYLPVIKSIILKTGKMLYNHEYKVVVIGVEDLTHNPIVPGDHNSAEFGFIPYNTLVTEKPRIIINKKT